MEHTSLGVHTFAFFQRLKEEDSFLLGTHFDRYRKKTGEMNGWPIKDEKDRTVGWEYTYKKPKGIRWRLRSIKIDHKLTIYGIMAIITPKVLVDNNYITVAKASDLDMVEELFNREAEKISPILRPFGSCSMSRGDPGLTFDLRELGYPCSPEQMIKLIKRGDIPKGFKERKGYDDDNKSHRKIADEYSRYLWNDSVIIDYYWKYPKINKNHPDYPDREKYRYVIRLEVECKYRKLYSLSKNIRHRSKFLKPSEEISTDELWEMIENDIRDPSIPIDVMMSDEMSANIIRNYFNKVIRKGDYLTLDGARWMVEAHNYRRDKKERLIFALEQVNKYRGIAKAKDNLLGEDLREFKRSLKDLDAILVNPVTIPRKWGIEHIPNPLRAYYNSITEEQLVPKAEILFEKLLAEYLS